MGVLFDPPPRRFAGQVSGLTRDLFSHGDWLQFVWRRTSSWSTEHTVRSARGAQAKTQALVRMPIRVSWAGAKEAPEDLIMAAIVEDAANRKRRPVLWDGDERWLLDTGSCTGIRAVGGKACSDHDRTYSRAWIVNVVESMGGTQRRPTDPDAEPEGKVVVKQSSRSPTSRVRVSSWHALSVLLRQIQCTSVHGMTDSVQVSSWHDRYSAGELVTARFMAGQFMA
jgi:hypothetical protein